MAAPAVAVERYRVEHGEGFTLPVVSMTDRRAAGNRVVRFVFQRHLETVLYAGARRGPADLYLEGDEHCWNRRDDNGDQQGSSHR